MRLATATASLLLALSMASASTQIEIPGPPGSGEFGKSVTLLPNGNFVVTDPSFDLPNAANVGAVYLLSPDGVIISRLTGSAAGDRVGITTSNLDGNESVIVLANGHFVVSSRYWDNGAIVDAGAVTWGHAETGFGAAEVAVSPANSLVGTSAGDQVGGSVPRVYRPVLALSNGHYLVKSPRWDNDFREDAGAVTWCNGNGNTVGLVTVANSLVGSSFDDQVGSEQYGGELANGHYVVVSRYWNNGSIVDAGAATWCNGNGGTVGPITPANSLVGTTANDRVGVPGLLMLSNGHYVIESYQWDNGSIVNAGAVTWCNGNGGTTGPVTAANSLVGTTANDAVSSGAGSIALPNGHYVVLSDDWNNGAIARAGAITWCDGNGGTVGPVTTANSLVGSASYDFWSADIQALGNGNYIVSGGDWDNGSIEDAGAVVWCDGNGGTVGPLTTVNSLHGTSAGDQVGDFGSVYLLSNGNYVVISPKWDNGGVEDVGAVTWCDGNGGTTGPVTTANSLHGTSAGDQIGSLWVPRFYNWYERNFGSEKFAELSNGHYFIISPLWDNGGIEDVGAVTWCNGNGGTTGPVTTANSLHGTTAGDMVGDLYVYPLTNGHYVVHSSAWDNGSIKDAGAATWCNGNGGTVGPVSAANSLRNTTSGLAAGEGVGFFGQPVTPLSNGNYVIVSPRWGGPGAPNAGAVTWCDGSGPTLGMVSQDNSLIGSKAGDRLGSWQYGTETERMWAQPMEDGNYIVHSPFWDNGDIVDAGALTFCNGNSQQTGFITSANSVIGGVAQGGSALIFDYDAARKQLIMARPAENRVILFKDPFVPARPLLTLARSTSSAPGAVDIAYAKPGQAVLFDKDQLLFETALIGSGASKGRNRALFSSLSGTGLDLLLQKGTDLSGIAGLSSGAKVASLLSLTLNQSGLGIFQATVTGKGVSKTNSRILFKDDGVALSPLLRTGNPVPALGNAAPASLLEVAQHYNADTLAIAYTLQASTALNVTKTNDSGILLLNHSGAVLSAFAREGGEVTPGGPVFGQFTGKAALGDGAQTAFTAGFVPAGETKPKNGVFSTNGSVITAGHATGAQAPETDPGTTFSSFLAVNVQNEAPLLRATLKGGSKKQNEGLWRGNELLLRKNTEFDSENHAGLQVKKILKFWPVGEDQLVVQAVLGGTKNSGVTGKNNQALLLRQADGDWQILLRTGDPAPGAHPATVAKISAVEVERLNGHYAVLATLKGVPASANQALWAGQTTLGDDDSAASERRPRLLLKKGDLYKTTQTPMGLIRGITLAPAPDKTGAGARGQGQAIGSDSSLLITLLGDRKVTEMLVIEPPGG